MSVRRLKFLHRSRYDATMAAALVLATGSVTAFPTLSFDDRKGIKAQKNSCLVAPSGCSPCSSPPPDGAGGTPLCLPHPHVAPEQRSCQRRAETTKIWFSGSDLGFHLQGRKRLDFTRARSERRAG